MPDSLLQDVTGTTLSIWEERLLMALLAGQCRTVPAVLDPELRSVIDAACRQIQSLPLEWKRSVCSAGTAP